MLAVETPQSPRRAFGFRPFSRKKKNKDNYPHIRTPPLEPEDKQTQYLTAYAHRISYTPRPTTITTPKRHGSISSTSSSSSSTASSTSSRVLSTTHPTLAFPPHTTTVPWDIFLPPTHIFSLYMGHLPTSPSDPWFIYSQGPDAQGKLKVHFHRARTGVKVAEVFVVMDLKGEGAGKVVGIKWDRWSFVEGMGGKGIVEVEAKGWVRRACMRSLGVVLEEENE